MRRDERWVFCDGINRYLKKQHRERVSYLKIENTIFCNAMDEKNTTVKITHTMKNERNAKCG